MVSVRSSFKANPHAKKHIIGGAAHELDLDKFDLPASLRSAGGALREAANLAASDVLKQALDHQVLTNPDGQYHNAYNLIVYSPKGGIKSANPLLCARSCDLTWK